MLRRRRSLSWLEFYTTRQSIKDQNYSVCVDEVDGSEKHKKILPKKKETKLRDLTGASVRPEKKR